MTVYWKDDFSDREKQELMAWVQHAETGLINLYGPMPFDCRVFIDRMESPDDDPVPWASTYKYLNRDVYFHVDMSFSRDTFMSDWTAPHELTHLMFPYVGDAGRWFSEGMASYLQYQVMYANQSVTWDEAMAFLQDRYEHAQAGAPENMSILELSTVVGELGAYVPLYWGGASYFMQVDQQLFETRQLRLNDILRQYLACCYDSVGHSVDDLIKTFDRLSGTRIFSETMEVTVEKPGFPYPKAALQWLAEHPPELLSASIHADR